MTTKGIYIYIIKYIIVTVIIVNIMSLLYIYMSQPMNKYLRRNFDQNQRGLHFYSQDVAPNVMQPAVIVPHPDAAASGGAKDCQCKSWMQTCWAEKIVFTHQKHAG